tara:strand:- start:2333 stop:2497 length:165 start_codon:yes stop_codon:yes gene_type:complete
MRLEQTPRVDLDEDDCVVEIEEELLIDDGEFDNCESFVRVNKQLNGVLKNGSNG